MSEVKLRQLGVGKRMPHDPFFVEGNSLCHMYIRQGIVDIDDEQLCHQIVAVFPCEVPGCKDVLSSLLDFEMHYNSCHRFICSQCRKSLPSAHLLDLHLSEAHDSFFAAQAERKPMFRCFVEECPVVSQDVSQRRSHCIEVHHFPHDFRYNQSKKCVNTTEQNTSGAATIPGELQNFTVASGDNQKKYQEDQTRSKEAVLEKIFGDINNTGITTLLKLYVAPFSNVMPEAVDTVPYDTEVVRSQMALTNLIHTPCLWLDPLRPYGISYNYPAGQGPPAWNAGRINLNLPDMAFRSVQVANTIRAELRMPDYSAVATTLKAFSQQELSALSQQRVLQPVRFQRDLQALSTILAIAPQTASSYYDEAPMLRLALLHLTMVTAEQMQRRSTIVQQIFDNCVPMQAPVVSWSPLPPNNTPGCKQPNNTENTTHMFAVGLDTFAQFAARTWVSINPNWLNVSLANAVVVPVKAEWSGSEWLVPYILSFTTTTWWNFARTCTWNGIRTRVDDNQLENAQLRTLVEASTVVVEGMFSHIILVIVDRNSDTYGPNEMYWIRNTGNWSVPVFTGQAAGVSVGNFAQRAYEWLGRAVGAVGVTSSLTRAWEAMCEMVAMPGMAKRVWTMASELSYTRPMPYTVVPGSVAAGARRFDGPWALTAEGIAIDGTNMVRWDLEKHSEATALTLLRAKSTLRHTSSGLYPSSACYIGTGQNHGQNIPCFNSLRYFAPQYSVNQSNYLARVAVASGLFITTCQQKKFNNVIDAQMYTQGLSALMLGVSGWVYGCTGLSTVINSGYVEMGNFAPEWATIIMTKASDKFIVPRKYGRTGFGVEDGEAADWNVAVLIQLYFAQATVQNTSEYSNINVPWWYVMAVQNKLGIVSEPKTEKRPRVMNAALGGGRQLVYSLSQSSNWSDLFLVTSDLSYESNHWNFAEVEEMDGATQIRDLFWYPDRIIDMTRAPTAEGNFAVLFPVEASGVISITMSGGDYTSQYITSTPDTANWMKYVVWGNTPVDLSRKETFPVVIGGLSYPDLFWDWLWEGAKKVGPHVLMGNWGAAAAKGFKHLAEPVAPWGADKIKT